MIFLRTLLIFDHLEFIVSGSRLPDFHLATERPQGQHDLLFRDGTPLPDDNFLESQVFAEGHEIKAVLLVS